MIPVRESIYPRFPGGKTKVFTLSFDDGVEQDIRLVSIMKARGITGTFNLNSGLFREENAPYSHPLIRRLPQTELVDLFAGSDMEIAVHGMKHPNWTELPPETALLDIIEDRKNLERIFQKPIRGCAYPYGAYNETVVRQLQAAGIRYARTVRDTENFSFPENWLTWHPTCHFAHKKIEEFTEKFLNEKFDKNPAIFYIWGHSYELEALNNWNVMETLLNRIGIRTDIWYETNIAVYDYMKAFHRLNFSAETTFVKNPSAISVWIEKKGEILEIPAGETKELPE